MQAGLDYAYTCMHMHRRLEEGEVHQLEEDGLLLGRVGAPHGQEPLGVHLVVRRDEPQQ